MQLQITLLEDINNRLIFCEFKNFRKMQEDYIDSIKNFKFKCIIFLLTMFINCVTGDNSSSDYVQSFERVAVFHNHVMYGHLGVNIDFDGYGFHVLRKSVLSFEEKSMSVYVKSVFSRLISVLDTNMFKIEEYKSLFLRTSHRSKRQFLAGVGVALGAAALYEVEAMKGTVNELVSNQNLLLKQMVSVTNATVMTAKNVEKLRGAVDLINAHAVTMRHVTTLEACVICLLYTSPSPRD